MDTEPNGIDAAEDPCLVGFDWWSAILGISTLIALGGAAWLRFGPSPPPAPPSVGSALPALRLIDLNTSEPLVLLGTKGKVVWLVFWSARTPGSREMLPKLEAVWKQLRSHRRFAMVAAATDSDQPEQIRVALAEAQSTLPVYLAGPETQRRFGADHVPVPLHFLIDPQGRVAATARGSSRDTLERLTDQAQSWLDELEPLGNLRYAGATAPETRLPLHRPPGTHVDCLTARLAPIPRLTLSWPRRDVSVFLNAFVAQFQPTTECTHARHRAA